MKLFSGIMIEQGGESCDVPVLVDVQENLEREEDFESAVLAIIADIGGRNVIAKENTRNPSVCERVIIASFDSDRQVSHAAQRLNILLKSCDMQPMTSRKKKNIATDWIAVDCGSLSLMVHLIQEPARQFYELDKFIFGAKGSDHESEDGEWEEGNDEDIEDGQLEIESLDLEYEGKSKKVYAHKTRPDYVVQVYKNSVSAFNLKKVATFDKKGEIACEICSLIFEHLDSLAVKSHYISSPQPAAQVTERLKMFSFEVTVRNVAAGNLLKRSHFRRLEALERPIVEFMYKSDELSDPVVCEDYVTHYLLDGDEESFLSVKSSALRVNEILKHLFASCGLILVDFKLEYGRNGAGAVTLGDEISPDTCRLLDADTKKSLDKDVFREDTGDLIESYSEVLRRLKEVLGKSA